MNFAEQLKLKAETEQERRQYERDHYDEKLISKVIAAIENHCNAYPSHRSLIGCFTSYSGSEYSISSFKKTEISKPFVDDHDFDANPPQCFTLNSPSNFEKILKQEISNLGFNSSNCGLIPVTKKKVIGTDWLGFRKYEESTVYVIWIEIVW